jgi:glutamate synthase (NADPH/NADH) small chain
VTVFERAELPGGLLMYGIPNMKLDKKEVVLRRIRLMEKEGIKFICNANVGDNVEPQIFLKEYAATVICTGATQPRDLPIEGRGLAGVHFAMEFLTANTKAVLAGDSGKSAVHARGKDVVVIGGGDTGSDCVGTSNRHKAMSVTQFELMPKPPHGRTEYMPWPTYPMILKTSSSHEEGADRHWAIATKEFIGDEQGNLKALKTIRLEWTAAADGKPAHFTEVPGSETELPCELALLAMGFVHPQHLGLLKELDIELDDRGNVRASEKTYQTNIAKVFTAGDMRRGQSLVVWAISEGRECARKVDEYLIGAPASLLERRDQSLIAL